MIKSSPEDLIVNSKKLEQHTRHKRAKPNGLQIIHERAAGIDIVSRFHEPYLLEDEKLGEPQYKRLP